MVMDYINSDSKELRWGRGASSFPLRDETLSFFVRPNARSTSMDLELEGSYLSISLAGDPTIEQGGEQDILAASKLYILCQPINERGRRVNFRSPIALTVVVYISPRWCSSCPRGPNCKVAQFLLRGNEGLNAVGGQAFDQDDRALAVTRALLDFRIDKDADQLSIEQSILALLSWAFVKNIKLFELPVKKCRCDGRRQ